jgi:transcriptional regulator with XRE-family HTH domain
MQGKNFVRKKVKSQTLGEKLRYLRESNGISVKDLSKQINVKVSYIHALENGQYDKLPMRVYAKGFVRSYARFFGVSENVYLSLFDKEYTVYQNINHKEDEEEMNKLPKIPSFIFTPKILIIIAIFAVLGAIGIYLYFSINNFVSSPFLVVDKPLNNAVVEADTIDVAGTTREDSKVFVNNQQIFVDEKGNFSDSINLIPGINVITVRSVNKFDKESIIEIVVESKYKVPEEEKKSNIHLIVKTQADDVWINAIADDVDVFNDTLEKEEEKTFDAIEKIILNTSSGSNTFVSVDGGQTFEVLGKEDTVVRDVEYLSEKINDDKKYNEIKESNSGGE